MGGFSSFLLESTPILKDLFLKELSSFLFSVFSVSHLRAKCLWMKNMLFSY